jgi:microcystin-dependent protein
MENALSRNGSGTQTTPNAFVAGTTITASDHNENWADVAAEITNSVAVDGQSTMTGPLKSASGTAALPGMAFGADTDTGFYRIGSDNIGAACNGAKVLDVATTGLTVTGTMDATALTQGGASLVPAGVMSLYAGSAAPTGYLLCDGSSKLRTDYPDLFTAIGTTYGAADGTHFSLPDMSGRVPAGKESVATRLTSTHFGGNSTTLGAVGGLESHTLTTAQLASHTHVNTLSDATHNHGIAVGSAGGGVEHVTQGDFGASSVAAGGPTGPVRNASSGVSINNVAAGSGSAHNNVQPTIILNYIIKT